MKISRNNGCGLFFAIEFHVAIIGCAPGNRIEYLAGMQADTTGATITIDGHITLEAVDDRHVEAIYNLAAANRQHLGKWLPWVHMMQSPEFIRNFVAGAKMQFMEKTDLAYVIVYDGEVVGRIGVYKIDQQNRIGSIGYWIGKAYEGKGIITTACRGFIDFCFTELALNRIEIKCGTGNQKSRGVPQRLGFTHEGIVRQGELVNGSFIDLHSYSLLKEEWNG